MGVMRGKDECVVRRGGCGVKVGWAWHEGRVGSNVVRCLCVLR